MKGSELRVRVEAAPDAIVAVGAADAEVEEATPRDKAETVGEGAGPGPASGEGPADACRDLGSAGEGPSPDTSMGEGPDPRRSRESTGRGEGPEWEEVWGEVVRPDARRKPSAKEIMGTRPEERSVAEGFSSSWMRSASARAFSAWCIRSCHAVYENH